MEAFVLGAAGGSAGVASATLAAKAFSECWDREAVEQRLEEWRCGKALEMYRCIMCVTQAGVANMGFKACGLQKDTVKIVLKKAQ